MMMMMMSGTPRCDHAGEARSARLYNLRSKKTRSVNRSRGEESGLQRRTRRGGKVRFQSCQPCFAFGGKGGQSRDPFAPTKKKIATMSPTLSPSSVVLPEAEEKSELNSSFERKEKKKDSEDDDENNSSENILPTPRERRRESEAKIPSRESEIQFVSLSELFPGTGFSEIFHGEAKFRTGIRAAMREDLFQESALLSDKQNKAIKSLNSSLMVPWDQFPKDFELGALTKLFKEYKITSLTGKEFITKISKLCGENPHGSLIDISNPALNRKKMKHSWHQDSGLDGRFTVMLGFPSENLTSLDERKEGVFSHAVRLSHKIFWPNKESGSVIEWESFPCEETRDHEIAESYIIRPLYGINQEIMVYCDAKVIHSAPDFIDREAVWRFM